MTYLGPDAIRKVWPTLFPEGPEPPRAKDARWDIPLRLGAEIFTSNNRTKDFLAAGQDYSIEPGEFALMLTEERIEMPDDVAGFISVRFEYKRRGLLNISGFHVDPGYQGNLVFAVQNAGPKPVNVRRGDPLFMLALSRLAPDELRDEDGTSLDHIPSQWITDVRGPPVTLVQVHERVKALEGSQRTLEEAWRKWKTGLWWTLGTLVTVGLATLGTWWVSTAGGS